MKIKPVNYFGGGMAVELVAETDLEHMLLVQIWEHGGMTRGNGSTVAPGGGGTGFYLRCEKSGESGGVEGDRP